MLANALRYYGEQYAQKKGVAAVVAAPDSPLGAAIRKTGAATENVSQVLAALDNNKYQVAIIPATPENLKTLQDNAAQLKTFTDNGGWVMLHGLSRVGLQQFNELTGWHHSLRPFRLERVTLENPDNSLAATIGNRDLSIYTNKEIMHGNYWLSSHVFSNVVGAVDAAPFTQMPDGPANIDAPYEATYSDNDPYNFVNGMVSADDWRTIRQWGLPKEGSNELPRPLVFIFHQPETIKQINIWNNAFYWTIKDLDIIIDGDTQNPIHTVLPPNTNLTSIPLNPSRRVEKSITLQIRSWRESDRRDIRLVGIDNVQFIRDLPQEYFQKVVPFDNVGGLVEYPRGKGGLFLNQLDFEKSDSDARNDAKKVRLLGTLLQNMGVSLGGDAAMVPGLNVEFAPIEINKKTNRFLKAREGQSGWFDDKSGDLSGLAAGDEYLADVLYHVSDFNAAPTPETIVLGGPSKDKEVKDISVNRKADALFFLHGAKVTRAVSNDEKQKRDFRAPELWTYIVHYTDGTTAEIPVVLGENVENWLQQTPQSLAGGRVAWSAPFVDAKADAKRSVLYSMTWNNPKPETQISTLDIVPGRDANRAVAGVVAITAGTRIGS